MGEIARSRALGGKYSAEFLIEKVNLDTSTSYDIGPSMRFCTTSTSSRATKWTASRPSSTPCSDSIPTSEPRHPNSCTTTSSMASWSKARLTQLGVRDGGEPEGGREKRKRSRDNNSYCYDGGGQSECSCGHKCSAQCSLGRSTKTERISQLDLDAMTPVGKVTPLEGEDKTQWKSGQDPDSGGTGSHLFMSFQGQPNDEITAEA